MRRRIGRRVVGRVLGWCIVPTLCGSFVLAEAAPAFAAMPVPLTSSTQTATGSWTILPMGDPADPDNTFWQVLRTSPGSARWSVVTPTGVADNGGIVAGVSGGDIVAGVLPSQLLRFSPLASSTDGGANWAPALFPGALAHGPSALAVDGTGGVAVSASWVFHAGLSLSTWSRLVSRSALARRDPRCGAEQLDAVAVQPDGTPLVAVSCRSGGAVGVFAPSGGAWREIGTHLASPWQRASTSTLRLQSTATGTGVLVSATSSRRRSLIALWRSAQGQWAASPALRLTPSQSVRASATGADDSFAVLVGTGRAGSVETIAPGRPWAALPAPPSGTVAVAVTTPPTAGSNPDSYDAFFVKGPVLRVYTLAPDGTRWIESQSSVVPLAYGSSS